MLIKPAWRVETDSGKFIEVFYVFMSFKLKEAVELCEESGGVLARLLNRNEVEKAKRLMVDRPRYSFLAIMQLWLAIMQFRLVIITRWATMVNLQIDIS